jgi:hypothetical protein
MINKNLFKKIEAKSLAGIEIETIYPYYEEENIVFKICSSLKNKMDDEGLFYIKDLLDEFSFLGEPGISDVGYLKSKNTEYTIMLHQYLRSGYSIFNGFGRIVPYLFGYYQEEKLPSLKIALDLDRIMLSKDWSHYCRREYYYGPKFTNDIPANKEGQASYILGVKDHLRTNSFQTDFYWKNKKDNSFQLEIEELQDTRYTYSPEEICCKYIHTQYNKAKSVFDHLDGSIRKYNSDNYLLRINGKLRDGKVAKETKLFRVDGTIPFDVWKSIIASFMEYNSNIEEYFNAE